MIANNPCRHLISKLVEHLTDAVLFLTNILPPPSKCTVLFRTGGGGGHNKIKQKDYEQNKEFLWNKIFFSPYLYSFFKAQY